MKTIKTILISILTSVAVVLFAFNVPATYFDLTPDKLGATITTLQGTSNLSDFPTTYNANLNAINTDLEAVEATTTMALLTSAPNLATVGTITSGTWTGSTIGVANGGTGATSLAQYNLLFGSSTNAIYPLGSVGTSGQLLTSNGAGALPSWTTLALDLSSDNTWTGNNVWTAQSFHSATSTFAGLIASSTVQYPLVLNGVSYTFPTTAGASSTIMTTSGNGAIAFNDIDSFQSRSYLATSSITNFSAVDTTSPTSSGTLATIPAGKLGTNGGVRFVLNFDEIRDTGANSTLQVRALFNSTTVCGVNITGVNSTNAGRVEFILANTSATRQICTRNYTVDNVFEIGEYTPTTVDTSVAINLSLELEWLAVDGGNTESAIVESNFIEFLGYQ